VAAARAVLLRAGRPGDTGLAGLPSRGLRTLCGRLPPEAARRRSVSLPGSRSAIQPS
jgi:hypothetical protein